jgi:hypothetical protein
MFRLPLKLEAITESHWGAITVRHTRSHQEAAEQAARIMQAIIPVVERYLGATSVGTVRLDLLSEARSSGVNAATGIIRHAARGFSERSPRTAGLLSYQVGHIIWYRSTFESSYMGGGSRSPYWLTEAALLPLMFIWSTRNDWLDYVSEQIRLVQRHSALAPTLLSEAPPLRSKERLLITAYCLLRGQSLSQRCDDWIRRLRMVMAREVQLSGLEALEQLTGRSASDWEQLFASDLEVWRSQTDQHHR